MTAILTLPTAAPARRPDSHELLPLDQYDLCIVSFSGGKDSLAMSDDYPADWVLVPEGEEWVMPAGAFRRAEARPEPGGCEPAETTFMHRAVTPARTDAIDREAAMICRHTLTAIGTCPNNGLIDEYTVQVYTTRVLFCEDIAAAVDELLSRPCHQESFTQALANRLRCRVRTCCRHLAGGRVLTDCVCRPRKAG